MESSLSVNEVSIAPSFELVEDHKVGVGYDVSLAKDTTATLTKFGGYVVDRNHDAEVLGSMAKENLTKAKEFGFDSLLEQQKEAWAEVWQMSDITIAKGDIKAQQGIRFNIFQLNQTYSEKMQV